MNFYQKRMIQPPGKPPGVIKLRTGKHTIAEASAIAIQEQKKGNHQAALDIFDLILANLPNSAEVFNNRGAILQNLGRVDEALASYDQAIALKPGYANAHFNRGSLLKKLNRFEDAVASFDQALAFEPRHVEAYNNRGVALQQMRRFDDALASYNQVIALKPDHAEACNNRGLVLANKGDMPEAEKMFLQAFALKSDFAEALFNLASIRKYDSVENPDVQNILALLARPGISPDDKLSLYFALGKIFDECGRYDEAFEYFRLANQLRNQSVAYDAAGTTRMTDRIIEVFSRDFLASPFPFASASHLPLFIVGMPRSGTTLLANILSNHRSIATAGELPDIAIFTSHLSRVTGADVFYPETARQITSEVATRFIQDYEQRLRGGGVSNALHIIDKNPLNFWHLGLIAKLFPEARIIHCTRDPFDTCLSNYFQRFPLALGYSFDLSHTGHFYREYARLMEHWRRIPTLKLIDVSYDDMILNTESVTRKTLDYLGLEWDERCLAPHANPAPVENASQWQVRQPIYRRSLERWRHYEKYLAPLKEMLGPSGQIPR
jgi:tetratricopeptide (TPR) repeat protein